MKIRTDWADPVLPTDLTWNSRVYSRVRKPSHRGALVGSLFGVPVDGNSCGRGTVYQFQTLNGDVHTVWWDGTMYGDTPYLLNVDNDASILISPAAIAWFCLLKDVVRIPDTEASDA